MGIARGEKVCHYILTGYRYNNMKKKIKKKKKRRKTITTNSLKLKRSGSPDVAHVALSLQWSVQK